MFAAESDRGNAGLYTGLGADVVEEQDARELGLARGGQKGEVYEFILWEEDEAVEGGEDLEALVVGEGIGEDAAAAAAAAASAG